MLTKLYWDKITALWQEIVAKHKQYNNRQKVCEKIFQDS